MGECLPSRWEALSLTICKKEREGEKEGEREGRREEEVKREQSKSNS